MCVCVSVCVWCVCVCVCVSLRLVPALDRISLSFLIHPKMFSLCHVCHMYIGVFDYICIWQGMCVCCMAVPCMKELSNFGFNYGVVVESCK